VTVASYGLLLIPGAREQRARFRRCLDVIAKNLPFLLAGLRLTAKLPRCRSSAAPCSDLRSDLPLHPHSLVAQSLDLYVAFMRGTPLLMVLSSATSPARAARLQDQRLWAAVSDLSCLSAHTGGDIRTGLRSSRRAGAGRARTGLTRWKVLRLIVVPIALRNVIPTLFSQYVRLIKFTRSHP